VDRAPILHETTPDKMGLWASVDRTRSVETVWFVERPGFFDAVFWLGDRTGPKVKLDLPTDVHLEIHRDWLTVKRRTPWTIGTTTYAPDTLLGISLSSFLDGNREFTVLFEPSERRALEHFYWNDGRLVVSILDELKPVFDVLTAVGARLGAVQACRPARSRRRARLAPRYGGSGKQRRSAGKRAGSAHARPP